MISINNTQYKLSTTKFQTRTRKVHLSEKQQRSKIFVGGIPPQSQKQDLYEFFINFGPIESIDIPVIRRKNTIKGFAFVVFKNPASAQHAQKYENPEILSKKIAIRAALNEKDAQKESERLQSLKLYVKGFSFETTELEIMKLFAPFGAVDRVLLAKDPESNSFRGFAYVVMRNTGSYQKLLKMKTLKYEGRKIEIQGSKNLEQLHKKSLLKDEAGKKASQTKVALIAWPKTCDVSPIIETKKFLSSLSFTQATTRKTSTGSINKRELNSVSSAFVPKIRNSQKNRIGSNRFQSQKFIKKPQYKTNYPRKDSEPARINQEDLSLNLLDLFDQFKSSKQVVFATANFLQ